jgi:hypothetical protein
MSLALRRGGGGVRCAAGAGRRRNRGEVAESEEKNVTPDLLLKHSDTTLATYIKR